jgi:multiple sugar transport system permease protein
MTLARASRILLAVAAALIVAWSFFDVGRRALARREMEHDRPITLTIMHWGDRAEDQIVQDLAERYMAEHPQVRIVRINPGTGDFRAKLKTMFAAGTPPDVFYLPPDLFPELATLKLIRPVDEYVAKDRAAGQGKYLDDFWPILMRAWHYDVASGEVGKGKLYGLPKDFTTSVMWVNVDLFNKAGVKVPYDGWTWDEYADACRKIRALSDRGEFAGRQIYGGNIEIWSDSLRNLVWTFGGDYFGKKPDGSPNFTDVTLDQPPAQEALEMVRHLRLDERTVFNVTGGGRQNNDLGFQQFLAGNIGCDGPVGRWKVPLLKGASFHWDCVPVPYREKKFQASQMYLTAWTMSSATKHADECWKLIKFLCGPEGAVQQSRAGLAIPPLISVAKSADFLNPPGIPPHHAQIFLDAVDYTRLQQLPRQSQQWARLIDNVSARALQLGQASTMEVAQAIEADWKQVLNSPLQRKQWKPMRWDLVIAVTVAALALLIALLWWKARREHLGPLDRAQERAGFAFILPWVIGFLALTIGPMIVSLLLSFTTWTGMTSMGDARAVGLANYQEMFTRDTNFYQSLRVTLYYVVLAVPIGQLAALGVAMLMNIKVRGITIFRTIYFVPSVVSGVALAVLWWQIFNNDYGLMNAILRPILHPLGLRAPDWFGVDAHHWAIPAFVIMSLWGVGAGMIIYLAGLKGIPASLYEAATLDGAGAVKKFVNVTLPMLSPLIFYNVVMGIIGSFQVFTQAVVMTNGGPDNATLFYVLNLYREAFEYHNMGSACAQAWVLFLIVLVLTILIFRGSKNLVYYEGLKT